MSIPIRYRQSPGSTTDLSTAAVWALGCSVLTWGQPQDQADFARAIGATQYLYLPPTPNILSGALVVTDGTTTLFFFDGANTIVQAIGAVVVSRASPATPLNGSAHIFFQLQASLRSAGYRAFLATLPPLQAAAYIGYSMGGAIAVIQAAVDAASGATAPHNVVTFGQPRVGNQAFFTNAPLSGNYLRYINGLDSVPTVPPANVGLSVLSTVFSLGQSTYNYVHPVGAFRITQGPDGSSVAFDRSDVGQSFVQPSPQAASAGLYRGITQFHPISYYIDNMTLIPGFAWPTPQFQAIWDRVGRYNVLTTSPPSVVPIIASLGQLADPNTEIDPTRTHLVTPLTDVGQTVELRESNFALSVAPTTSPLFIGELGMAYKITMFFSAGFVGWSESYWTTLAIGNPANAVNNPSVQALVAARTGCMGSDTRLIAIRCSSIAVPQTVWPTPPRNALLLQWPGLPLSNSSQGKSTLDPNAALILQCLPVTAGQPKLIYLRGFPLDWFGTATYLATPLPGGFTTAMNAFSRALTGVNLGLTGSGNGWFWDARTMTNNTAMITALAQGVGPQAGKVVFTVASNIFPVGAIGNSIPVRFSELKNTCGNLNGPHPIIVTSQSAGYTKRQIAVLPWSGNGKVQYPGGQLNQFASVNIQRMGERKCGRPYDTERGRAPVRVQG